MIFQFPGLILTPTFSHWTFGEPKGCCYNKESQEGHLKLSFRLSWINFIINCIVNVGLTIAWLITSSDNKTGLIKPSISFVCLGISGMTLKYLQNYKTIKRTALNPSNSSQLIETSMQSTNQFAKCLKFLQNLSFFE